MFKVTTLIGRKTMELGVECLESFCRHCKDQYQLVIFEDGTLTKNDKQELKSKLDKVTIIDKKQIEETVREKLSKYPNCLNYREKKFLSIKLLDIPLIVGEDYGYLDSDVYFFQDFKGFNRANFEGEELVNMMDIYDCYSISFFTRYFSGSRIRIPDKVNVGMSYVSQDSYDLDLVEWFLGKDEYTYLSENTWRSRMLDQTGFALLSTKSNSFYWDPQQIFIPNSVDDLNTETVAIHFVSTRRKLYNNMKEKAKNLKSVVPPVQLQTRPVEYTNAIKAAGIRLKDKIFKPTVPA